MGEISSVQNPIQDWGEANGFQVRKVQYVCRRGCPDLLIAGFGSLFLMECKTPRTNPDPLQSREIERYRSRGVHVYVVHSAAEGIDILRKVRDDATP